MEKVTNSNVNEYQVNGIWNIKGSMKMEKGSSESKNFTLKVRFSDVPMVDIINKALDPTKIQWVNGPGRTHFDKWASGQLVEVDFKAPGRAPVVDPEVAILERAKAMNKAERQAYVAARKAELDALDELE